MIKAYKFYKMALLASVRSLMQYKFSFLFNFVTTSFISLSDFLPVFVILHRFKSIDGWGVYQVALLWGCVSISLGITRAFTVEIHTFQEYIVNGKFDSLLIRPFPTLLLLLSRRVQFFRLSISLQGLIVFIIAAIKLRLDVFVYLYIPVLVISGFLIMFSMEIIIAATSFWLTRTGDLLVFLFYGPVSAAAYPLSMFPNIIKGFLTIWPIAFIGYKQISFFLGFSHSKSILWISPMISVVFFAFALMLWRLGEQNYHSTGS